MMTKTKEKIRVRFWNGKEQNKTVYVDENGKKHIYSKGGFVTLEYFKAHWNVIE